MRLCVSPSTNNADVAGASHRTPVRSRRPRFRQQSPRIDEDYTVTQAKRDAGRSQLVPAVGYTRRSTDKQETSIADQTQAIQRYADDKGYRIVRWYTDDAISGDDTQNRLGFQRMLVEAQEKHDFEVVICWDQSRFGRFSPQEAGYWTYQFSRANVGLVTVDKGPIDWNDFTGWLTYSVNQHSKHDYLVQLSKDVMRGQQEATKNASWLGMPPYGYRIEGGNKAKRLVIDSPGQMRVVQRIFQEFVNEGRSMSDVARRLQADGIVPPGIRKRGKHEWRYDSVRVILENPAYAGDYASRRVSYGKYHTMQNGQAVRNTGGRKAVRNPEPQWVVRRDTHEAVIDRQTFDRAQAMLAVYKEKMGRRRFTPETNPFLLNGLLRCGKCGGPMWGDTVEGRKFYRCGTWQRNGAEACEGTKVSEPEILEDLGSHLENWLGLEGLDVAAYYGALKPGDLPEAFEQVKKLVCPPQLLKSDRKKLEKRGEELRSKVDKARANLVLLEPDNIPAAQERIRQLDDELVLIEKELKSSAPPAERDVNAVALEVLHNLYSLAYCCRSLARSCEKGMLRRDSLEKKAPQAVRRFLSHASHIVCHTTKTGTGTGTRHKFEKGEVVFRGVGVTTGVVNLHNRAS